jgi:ubiquinone/menaquinone biosynthesis C-methylase UbiE
MVRLVPDRLFSEPRLVQVYDPLDPDRRDLDAYLALLEELHVRSVVDVGCGTGTFAIMLATSGREVTGIDPAEASLEMARAKPDANSVRWILGDASAAIAGPVDAVTMTGNVAQVFVTDDDWREVVQSAFRVLRPGGHLIFETRDPAAQAWRGWNRKATYRDADVPGAGRVACWEEVTAVDLPLVSFRTIFEFHQDGSKLTSNSTLRFRDREEIKVSLRDAGFDDPEVRGAPDRPNLEIVFIARRPEP